MELLHDRNHKRGQAIVENAFGILKNTFDELFIKIDLIVFFVPNVFITYYLLHNLL
jgi:hypothetical protein